LFEQQGSPAQVAQTQQQAVGGELFNIWLAKVWPQVQTTARAPTRRTLVISSDEPDILNLPWELLRVPGSDFLGFDPTFSIRRYHTPTLHFIRSPVRCRHVRSEFCSWLVPHRTKASWIMNAKKRRFFVPSL
jgi:hypothetical protein